MTRAVSQWSRAFSVATLFGMEKLTEHGRQVAALVTDASGAILGHQTRNQLDPTEDAFYVTGSTRRVFEVNGTTFGIAICHEG